MPIEKIITYSEWFFIVSFIIINLGYLMISVLATIQLKEIIKSKLIDTDEHIPDQLQIPISILVPAYNESKSIVVSINSMLRLDYPKFEIIIINDGSTDSTLEILKKELALVQIYKNDKFAIPTKFVKDYYQSSKYTNIWVIDKENGGKADSLNAGLNISHYPLFCSVDADSILDRNSLKSVVHPFLTDPTVIAAGGTIRIANGCTVKDGELKTIGVPTNPLALIQVVEYLHAFLFGRLGWVPISGLLVLSGAFSLFLKKYVVETGGYRTDTVGEDMELVMRLHKYMREKNLPYKITFMAEPVCWTEAPQDFRTLQKQRTRWQRGLGESLALHYDMFLNRKMGSVGLISYPFTLFFELLSPILETLGYLFFFISFYLGFIHPEAMIAFLLASIGLGILISISAILLEELTFQVYKKKRYIFMLFLGAIIENIGYRQINSFWRLTGLIKFVFNTKFEWGTMKRHGNWH